MKRSAKQNAIFKGFLAVLFLLILAGCSSGESKSQTPPEQMEPEQSEMEKLAEENEKLRAELEAVLAAQQSPEPEEEPEEETEETVSIEIVAPQRSPQESLIGEWFFQDFHEENISSWTQSLIFNADGTGTIIRTFYMPTDLGIEDFSTSLTEATLGFSWELDGDKLHTVYENDGGTADYTFSPEQQQLFIINNSSTPQMYVRQMPSIPPQYVTYVELLQNLESQSAAMKRRFLGGWFYDVLEWTFNEDNSGLLYIPKLGDNPEENREFTYKVSGKDKSDLFLTIDWADGRINYFWPEIHDDGSITLKGSSDSQPIDLTRQFDISNCPISEAIISREMSVLSGSIFSDILPDLSE